MARKPKSMRQIKEILRLKHEHHLSVREIGRSCGLPSSTVSDYLLRAQARKSGIDQTLLVSLSHLRQKLGGRQVGHGANQPVPRMRVDPLQLSVEQPPVIPDDAQAVDRRGVPAPAGIPDTSRRGRWTGSGTSTQSQRPTGNSN